MLTVLDGIVTVYYDKAIWIAWAGDLQTRGLPRRMVTAHVVLPNFSPGGNYLVSITTDHGGASEKATGRAVANVKGFHADLTVALDLRSLPPGTCLLATTHEGDPASYFYPLTIH